MQRLSALSPFPPPCCAECFPCFVWVTWTPWPWPWPCCGSSRRPGGRTNTGAQGYLYSLCPFKEAKQDRSSLGRWQGWERREPGGAPAAMLSMMMLFDGGSRCHTGKRRCVVWWFVAGVVLRSFRFSVLRVLPFLLSSVGSGNLETRVLERDPCAALGQALLPPPPLPGRQQGRVINLL